MSAITQKSLHRADVERDVVQSRCPRIVSASNHCRAQNFLLFLNSMMSGIDRGRY